MSTNTLLSVGIGFIVLQIGTREYQIRHTGEVFLITRDAQGCEGLHEVFGDELEQVIIAGLPYTEIPF